MKGRPAFELSLLRSRGLTFLALDGCGGSEQPTLIRTVGTVHQEGIVMTVMTEAYPAAIATPGTFPLLFEVRNDRHDTVT